MTQEAREVLLRYGEAEDDEVSKAFGLVASGMDSVMVVLVVHKVLPSLVKRPLPHGLEKVVTQALTTAEPAHETFWTLLRGLLDLSTGEAFNIPAIDILVHSLNAWLGTQGSQRRLQSVVRCLCEDAKHISDPSAAAKHVSNLVHLPDIISNAMHGSLYDLSAVRHDKYYTRLGKTITVVLGRFGEERDGDIPPLLPVLLRRFITVSGGEPLVTAALGSEEPILSMTKLFELVPMASLATIVRVSLSCAVHQPDMYNSLINRIRDPEVFKIVANLPLKRPLVSSEGLVLLRDSLSEAARLSGMLQSIDDAIYAVATIWSDSAFYLNNDTDLHGQVTRFLLLMLQRRQGMPPPGKRIVFLLARGVQEHLSLSDDLSMWFGMLVGEAFSRYVGDVEPLRFDRPKNITTDSFDDLAGIARDEAPSPKTLPKPIALASQAQVELIAQKSSNHDIQQVSASEDLNGDDDFVPYDMSSSDEEDVDQMLAKKISVPSSLPRLLGLLRQFNREEHEVLHNPELLQALLSKLICVTGKPSENRGIESYCPEFARGLLMLNATKYPEKEEEKIETLRKDSLRAVARLCPRGVCGMLLQNYLYRESTLLVHRREILWLSADTARALCGRIDSVYEPEHTVEKQQLKDVVGTTTRKLERSIERATLKEKHLDNLFAPLAPMFYEAVMSGLRLSPNNVDYARGDATFLAQGIAVLSVFLTCAGPQCNARESMAISAIELCIVERHHGKPEVRRGVCLLFGAAIESLHEDALMDLQVAHAARGMDLMAWLLDAIEEDSDQGVRAYARHAASKLATIANHHQDSELSSIFG